MQELQYCLDAGIARSLWREQGVDGEWRQLPPGKDPNQRPGIHGPGGGLVEARTRLLLAQAATAELNLRERESELVPLMLAKRVIGAVARTHRDATLAFAARRGPELAGKWGVDVRLVVADLDAALRVMLEEVASDPVQFEGNAE